jgi:hypothetical protein
MCVSRIHSIRTYQKRLGPNQSMSTLGPFFSDLERLRFQSLRKKFFTAEMVDLPQLCTILTKKAKNPKHRKLRPMLTRQRSLKSFPSTLFKKSIHLHQNSGVLRYKKTSKTNPAIKCKSLSYKYSK